MSDRTVKIWAYLFNINCLAFVQPIAGFATSEWATDFLSHAWDRRLDTKFHSDKNQHGLTANFDLGALFVVNAVAIHNRKDWCKRNICG